jgi:hypothetical protein
MLQRVEHLTNGNTIIFMSHHNVNEAREKVQAFTAFYVWIDEMAKSLSLITELLLRIQSSNGRLLLTYTPLIRNPAIHKWTENLDARVGKLYNFHMFDNPIFKGREEEVLASFKDIPENERRARLFGEPYTSDQLVYSYDSEIHESNPQGYHPSWRHVEVVDPAASGTAGFMLMAESPTNNKWYVIKTDYVKGAAASDLVLEIAKRSEGLNIVKRVCDPHEVWFIKEAHKLGRSYVGVYDKANRKKELINNIQERLHSGIVKVASWCVDLQEEFSTCQWSETNPDKIVGSARFHLLDCLQYGIDNLPKSETRIDPKSWEHQLRDANRERIRKEAVKAKFGRYKPKAKIWARRGKQFKAG